MNGKAEYLTTDELKPCPFCGSMHLSFTGYSDDNTLGIYCRKCNSFVVLPSNRREGDTPEIRKKAIKAWNRRTLVVEATIRYIDDIED